jgi:hypothetical protein
MSYINETQPQAQPPGLDPISPAAHRTLGAGAGFPPQVRPKRSGAPLGLGITLIAGAGVLLLFSAATHAMNAWLRSSQSSGIKIPDIGTEGVQLAMTLVQAALSLIALAAGIGLVRYRTWGRHLSIGWAVAALAYVVTSTAVSLLYIMPASQRAMQAMELPGNSSETIRAGLVFGSVMSLAGAVVLAVTPTLTLVLMTRLKVRQACA